MRSTATGDGARTEVLPGSDPTGSGAAAAIGPVGAEPQQYTGRPIAASSATPADPVSGLPAEGQAASPDEAPAATRASVAGGPPDAGPQQPSRASVAEPAAAGRALDAIDVTSAQATAASNTAPAAAGLAPAAAPPAASQPGTSQPGTSQPGTSQPGTSQPGATASLGMPARPAEPSAQIAPALVTVARGPEGASVSVQLDPASLGKVSVTVQHAASGAAHVVVVADRPETLQLLQQDRPALQHALDQAGLSPQGRELTFSLGAPETRDAAAPSWSGARDGAAGGSGQGGSGGGGSAASDGSGSGGQPPRQNPVARWLRAGVDITA